MMTWLRALSLALIIFTSAFSAARPLGACASVNGCPKDWTILVYMEADNDLYPYALWDLYEMEAGFSKPGRAASTGKADLVVQVNGPADDDQRRLHIISQTNTFAIKTVEDFNSQTLDSVKSPIIMRVPENDGKSEQTRLTEFLLWGRQNYPAKNYMVIVWGHGEGWKAYPSKKATGNLLEVKDLNVGMTSATPVYDSSFGGIGFSESSGTWLDVPALRDALDTFAKANGKPVDVYASDACNMQMLEVATELSNSARFLVGSSQIQDYQGMPYRVVLHELNTGHFNGLRGENKGSVNEFDEPYLMAKMLPKIMKESLNPRHGGQRGDIESYKFMTSSALTSTELQNLLIPEIKRLGTSLSVYLKEDPRRAPDLTLILQNVPRIEGGAQDFGIFLGLVETLLYKEKQRDGALSPAAEQLTSTLDETKAMLDRAILSYMYGPGYTVDDPTQMIGLVPRAVSLWLPTGFTEFRLRRDEFKMSRFYQATHWDHWLTTLYRLDALATRHRS